jgi:hypothetical protein
MMRQSEKRLLERLASAKSIKTKAVSHLDIAIFHDNYGRESQAIPHYVQALKFGLAGRQKMEALVWLASSYWKTGRPKLALASISRIQGGRDNRELRAWIRRLQKRIDAAPHQFVR